MLGAQIEDISLATKEAGRIGGWSEQEILVKTNEETSKAVGNALDTLLFQAQKNPAVAEQASGLLRTYAPYMTPETVRRYGELIRSPPGYQIDQVVKRDRERNKNTRRHLWPLLWPVR